MSLVVEGMKVWLWLGWLTWRWYIRPMVKLTPIYWIARLRKAELERRDLRELEYAKWEIESMREFHHAIRVQDSLQLDMQRYADACLESLNSCEAAEWGRE